MMILALFQCQTVTEPLASQEARWHLAQLVSVMVVDVLTPLECQYWREPTGANGLCSVQRPGPRVQGALCLTTLNASL